MNEHFNSYVAVGGKLANKIVKSINNIERHSEYTKLVKNPYAYNEKANVNVFEEEIEVVEKPKAEVVQEKPAKDWFN